MKRRWGRKRGGKEERNLGYKRKEGIEILSKSAKKNFQSKRRVL